MPEMSAPVMETAVATETQIGIGMGVLIVSCLTLIAAFGSVMMAGVTNLTTRSTCTDTDGGKNYNMLGYVKDSYDGTKSYGDYCTLNGAQVASCTDKTKNCGMIERYCNSNGRRSGAYIYGSAFWRICPNGCKNGACLPLVPQPKSKPVVAPMSLPSQVLSNGVNTIAKFTIFASSTGYVSWKKINFKYYLSNASSTLSNCSLINNASTSAALIQINKPDINITLSNEQVIANGSSQNYALSCLINGTLRFGDSLSTQIEGNFSTSTSPMTYNDVVASGENRFIWSDLSAIQHNASSSDWYGSYGIQGLPSSQWILLK